MHDPMCVAHEVPFPFPKRKRWADQHYDGHRWGWTRRRRTNAENLGEPIYRFWRPAGWTFALAGRVFQLCSLATIWHVEPKGRDSGEVCKHYIRSRDPQPSPLRVKLDPFIKPLDGGTWYAHTTWKWHVHHWRIQVPLLGRIKRFVLERCEECGRRYPWGYAPISHQWDSPGVRWRDGITRRAYHHECSGLIHLRGTRTEDENTIRALVAACRVEWDVSEEEAVNRLGDAFRSAGNEGFRRTSRLAHLHGMKMRQSDARWVHPDGHPAEELI